MTRKLATPNEAAMGSLDVLRREYLRIHVAEDTSIPECVLATYAANRLPLVPVWLLLVGPPSSGKTAALGILSGLPGIHAVGTASTAALLSGSPQRERKPDSTGGGVLREMTPGDLLVIKDFTSILSMSKDNMMGLLAAFREIYDGSWTRLFGSDGGRKETWSGKIGMIGAVTQTIDTKHAAMNVMGERFVQLRYISSPEGSVRMARRAISSQSVRTTGMKDLAHLSKGIIDLAAISESNLVLPLAYQESLISLSVVVTACRSGIERNGYTHEIEHVSDREEPGRLIKQLGALFCGLLSIGNTYEEAWQNIKRVGLDSMPDVRRRAVFALRSDEAQLTTQEVADVCQLPATTIRRALEDLFYLRVVTREQHPEAWSMDSHIREGLEGIEINPSINEDVPYDVLGIIDDGCSPDNSEHPPFITPANTVQEIRVSSPNRLVRLREFVNEHQERSQSVAAR